MADRTLLRTVAAAGALTLLLAACGSDSEPADPAAGGGDTASEAPVADEAAPDCTPEQATAGSTPSTDPLNIGTLLPETGNLAFLGPPEIAGVELAINDINAAGGVLEQDVTLSPGDSGDATTDTANQTVDRLIAGGSQVIIGAASSGVSLQVIDKIAEAGVVQFSPANTSDQFTCYADSGQYFRTAPADVLQAQALAQVIAGDGVQRLSILALNDPYGTGLAENLQTNLEAAGIPADQIQTQIYDPQAQSFNAEIDAVVDFAPDGVAVIGFDESKRIITRMAEVGVGPADLFVYGSDGNIGNALGEGLAPGLLAGVKGTLPLTEVGQEFQDRLLELDPALVDFNYAGESYDAAVVSALAAVQVGSTNGVDIASAINSITKEGEKCTTYEECLPLAQAGTDLDYDGVTGELEFTDAGEPAVGSYGVQEFGEDNTLGDPTFVVVGG